MSDDAAFNKYRAAIGVLQRGRDVIVDGLAEDVLAQAEDLAEGGFLFNEFLESQGTRLHFLGLLIAHLEQSADGFDQANAEAEAEAEVEFEAEAEASPPPKPPRKRKPRAKKVAEQAPPEGKPDDF